MRWREWWFFVAGVGWRLDVVCYGVTPYMESGSEPLSPPVVSIGAWARPNQLHTNILLVNFSREGWQD